jgi:hypothetical protein
MDIGGSSVVIKSTRPVGDFRIEEIFDSLHLTPSSWISALTIQCNDIEAEDRDCLVRFTVGLISKGWNVLMIPPQVPNWCSIVYAIAYP